MESIEIGPVLEIIKERSGIDFTQYRTGTLKRRISRRLAACGCTDPEVYISLLNTNPREYDRLLSDLTIKFTEFFRDPWIFDLLRDDVLPELIRQRIARRGELAVWSAGCATGEEAYSIAALLREMARTEQVISTARIFGTDIDPQAIEKARRGSFIPDLLPSRPKEPYLAYFREGENTIRVEPELRSMIQFGVVDMLAQSAPEEMRRLWPGYFDLVLCRNLLIYLEKPAQARVLKLCTDMLSPGGFLVLGSGEMLPKTMEIPLITVHQKARIYRRLFDQE